MNSKSFLAVLASAAITAAEADEVTYRTRIAPLVKARCESCHGATAPTLEDFLLEQDKYKKAMKGPRLDSYGSVIALVGWPDSGALMRRLDDGSAAGKPGNMYDYLGKNDEERKANFALVKAWVGDDAWNLQRWKKRGEVPAITKEEMDKLKLKY